MNGTVLYQVLYGYQRRSLAEGCSPSGLLYGIVPKTTTIEATALVSDSNVVHRRLELEAVSSLRATRGSTSLTPREVAKPPQIFSIGDKVLVARGTAFETVKWPVFQSKYFGPCTVPEAKHPCYELTSPHGRRTRSAIHARWLIPHRPREQINAISIIMSQEQSYHGVPGSYEEVEENQGMSNEPPDEEQSPPESISNSEFRIMQREDLFQLATSELNAWNIYYRLICIANSILDSYPPDLSYNVATIGSEILDELPNLGTLFTNHYLMRDPPALDLLLGGLISTGSCSPTRTTVLTLTPVQETDSAYIYGLPISLGSKITLYKLLRTAFGSYNPTFRVQITAPKKLMNYCTKNPVLVRPYCKTWVWTEIMK